MLNYAVSFQRCLTSLTIILIFCGTGCLNAADDVTPLPLGRDTGSTRDVGVARDAITRPLLDARIDGDTSVADALSDAVSKLHDASTRFDADRSRDVGSFPGDSGSNPQQPLPDAGSAQDTGTSDSGTSADTGAHPDAGAVADSGTSADAGAVADAGTDTDTSAPDAGSQPQPSSPPAFLAQSNTRAMWLWADAETSKAFLDNRWGMQDALMQFAAAPHGQSARSLNRLFFEVRTYSRVDLYTRLRAITYEPLLDPVEQAKLRAFNKRANAQGMEVEYLDGQAIWLATDANAQFPKQVCQDVVTFNLTTTDVAERLAGVHFDIEPHVVHSGPWAGQWWQNKLPNGYNADWTRRWKEIMNACRATFDAYEAQTGHHLTLTGDLGADYAYYNKPILDFFNGPNSPVDYVTLMNYYDNRPNQSGQPSFFYGWNDGFATTGGVVQNLALWNNVPVLFGIETGPTGIAADYMSFYQEGYTAMYGVVDQLTQNHSGPGMLGVAFHPWGSFKDLQP